MTSATCRGGNRTSSGPASWRGRRRSSTRTGSTFPSPADAPVGGGGPRRHPQPLRLSSGLDGQRWQRRAGGCGHTEFDADTGNSQASGIAEQQQITPGAPAEEQFVRHRYFVRDGHFDDVDVACHNHIPWEVNSQHGQIPSAMISATFICKTAHAAMLPWKSRDALDAVVLMDVGWRSIASICRPAARPTA